MTLSITVFFDPDLVVYTDVDWTVCPDTHQSTSGYTVFIGANLVSYSSKRQLVVTCSSALVYCAVNAVYFSTNPMHHQRMKYVEIDIHSVRERVAVGDLHVLRVPTTSHFVDIFTKGLSSTVFTEFRSSINICT